MNGGGNPRSLLDLVIDLPSRDHVQSCLLEEIEMNPFSWHVSTNKHESLQHYYDCVLPFAITNVDILTLLGRRKATQLLSIRLVKESGALPLTIASLVFCIRSCSLSLDVALTFGM